MALEEKKTRHELLIRFGKNEEILGGHIQFLHTIYRDGEWVQEAVGDAMPISMDSQSGFKLDDVLTDVQIAALKTAERALADVNKKEKEIEIIKSEKLIAVAQAEASKIELEALRKVEEKKS